MKHDSYAISKPTGKQNREESWVFTVGRGICSGFDSMLCLSSLDRPMRWTQNSSFGSSGTSLRPETLYSYNPDVRQLAGSQTHSSQCAYLGTNNFLFQNVQRCRGAPRYIQSAGSPATRVAQTYEFLRPADLALTSRMKLISASLSALSSFV
jgi:hypothetical protein